MAIFTPSGPFPITVLTADAQRDQDMPRLVFSSCRRTDTMRQTYAGMGTSLKQAFVRRLIVWATL